MKLFKNLERFSSTEDDHLPIHNSLQRLCPAFEAFEVYGAITSIHEKAAEVSFVQSA